MPRTIITQITSKGTVYRLGNSLNQILTDVQVKTLKKRLINQQYNADNTKRGSFLAFAKKAYTL